jgi:hypothetical protein
MHLYAKRGLGVLGALIFALPAVAAASIMHTDSTEYDVTQPMMIGNSQLQPGSYTIRAQESQSQLDVLHEGKVVATVPCTWVRLNKKPQTTEVLSNQNKITEVEFQGRTEAAKIS